MKIDKDSSTIKNLHFEYRMKSMLQVQIMFYRKLIIYYHRIAMYFRKKKYIERDYLFDYEPVPGQKSAKAERLVDLCLGNFKGKPPLVCTQDFDYLQKKFLLLFKTGRRSGVLRSGRDAKIEENKEIVEALISQRANIPDNFTSWIIRGDSSGEKSVPEQGLHLSGMRRFNHRHLVLVPTADRQRYMGPNLARQMEELRGEWTPWNEKSDTAWWGGALTGDDWQKNEPRTLTRREVLSYFQNSPSDQLRLHLAETHRKSPAPPRGVKVKGHFTKRDAFRNKCLILLPGNDIASGSSWYFAGNSVVLMPKPHLEHILYFEMNPWEHYVPLENDPADILVKLKWVLENEDEAQRIVERSHERLRWLCGPEYLWACNEVLRRISSRGTEPA